MTYMVVLETPVKARLVGYEAQMDQLAKDFSYTDKSIEYEIVRLRKTCESLSRHKFYIISQNSEEYWVNRVASIKNEIRKLQDKKRQTLLFRDTKGLWTYSGLVHRLNDPEILLGYQNPSPRAIPWAKRPLYPDRVYQTEAFEKLVHGAPIAFGGRAVEIATGGGKSQLIRNLVKHYSLGSLIGTPSKSIAYQIYDDLVHHFGKKYVGLFGDGKKDFKKLFVVAIGDSLALLEPGMEAYQQLSQKQVFILDEAHSWAADSLEKISFNLMQHAPHRFFVSATQFRNDGRDLLLEAITGPIVYSKTLRELVDEGYLAKPTFKMVQVQSDQRFVQRDDAMTQTRKHLFRNKRLHQVAAELATHFVNSQRPTLILVEEVDQFSLLLPHLAQFGDAVKFAHGPLTASNKKNVPVAYHSDKPKDLVARFNAGEIKILVGTSCITTGTDMPPAEAGIYLMGSRSEIKVSQALGRVTRGGHQGVVTNPWTGKKKVEAIWVDFDVQNNPTLHRHAAARSEIYQYSYAAPKHIVYGDPVNGQEE